MPGRNLLTTARRGTISLGGKNTVLVAPGDILDIMTPGGGGFGSSETPAVCALL